ncbi:unnamed protein product [Linum tenue]|uniref:Uncharacterized protein n=1 Tax=Linum tenue TaxID=586396 RepID=A0AAV0IUE7_9ROSI|nr:unnamed protein product [Linum tenue]
MTQSHLTEKQHLGYGLVRDFISEYKVECLKSPGFCITRQKK